jgi:hypothetical protein
MFEQASTYHSNLLLSLVHNLNTSTTVVTVVPYVLRHAGGTINGGRQNIIDKSARPILPAGTLSRPGQAVEVEMCVCVNICMNDGALRAVKKLYTVYACAQHVTHFLHSSHHTMFQDRCRLSS